MREDYEFAELQKHCRRLLRRSEKEDSGKILNALRWKFVR